MNRRLGIIFFIVFTNLVGAGMIIPTLPLYAEGKFHASAFEVAFVVALFYLAQFIGSPIMGQLSDKFGRRPVLIWSQVGTILSFVLFLLAEPFNTYMSGQLLGWVRGGMIILYCARILDGITGGNITVAQAYISDITNENERAHAFGYVQTAYAVGLILGPAFGGLLANINLAAPFVGAIAITALSTVVTIFFLGESLEIEKRHEHHATPHLAAIWIHYLSNTTVLVLLCLSFVVAFAMGALSAVFALFASHQLFIGVDHAIVARNVGYMMAFMGLAAVLSQVALLKRLVDRWGETNVIIISIFTASLSCIAFSYFSDPLLITLALLPSAFSFAVGLPTGQSLLMRFSDEKTSGQLLGLYHATNSLAYFVGPLVGGYLFDRYSPRMPFIVSGVVVGIGLALAFSLKWRTIPKYSYSQQ